MALDNEGNLIFIFVISLLFILVYRAGYLGVDTCLIACVFLGIAQVQNVRPLLTSERPQRVSIADSGFERISNKNGRRFQWTLSPRKGHLS